jgi:hypothetical protein
VLAQPAGPDAGQAVRLVLILDVWHPAIPKADREQLGRRLVGWSDRKHGYSLDSVGGV